MKSLPKTLSFCTPWRLRIAARRLQHAFHAMPDPVQAGLIGLALFPAAYAALFLLLAVL